MVEKVISRHRIFTGLLFITGLVFAGSVMGGTFVSYKGKYAITYPANWKQVDYNTVDYFLSQGGATPQTSAYEAVFADSAFEPFLNGVYLVIDLDSSGDISAAKMDSLRDEFIQMFGGHSKTAPAENFMAALVRDTPTVSTDGRLVAVEMDVTEPGQAKRTSVAAVKVYEHGAVNFYFYAPDSLMSTARPAFQTIVASFTTDIEAAKPREAVKVADADKVSGEGSRRSLILIGSGVVVIIIVAMVMRRKRRARQGSTGTGA